MADLTEQQLLNTDPEVLGLQRQRQLANLLTGQAFNQPQGQMISGYYVKPSGLQQALPMINAAIGGLTNANLDEKQLALANALRGRGVEETQKILELAKTNPNDALALASNAQTPQGRAFAPTLMQSILPKKTDKLVEYDTYKAEGGKKSFSDWAREITPEQQAKLDIDRQRLGLEGARLGLEREKLAAELGGGKLNDEQGKAVGFGTRAKEASAILNKLETEGVKDIGKTRAGIGALVGMTPLIGEKLEQNVISGANVLPSYLGGPNEQQQATLQARKNFATAILRKESGASISPTEFADVNRIYFPEPGDDATIVRQKQRARDLAIKSLEVQAGPGARFIKEFQPQTDFGGAKKVVNYNDLP
jgi:hypothetical protein